MTAAVTPIAASAKPTREQTDVVRLKVRELLEQSPAFMALPADKQREIANQTVQVCSYLAVPDGIPGNVLPTAQALASPLDRQSSRSGSSTGSGPDGAGKFVAQGAREGANVAGLLLQQVNFPSFVSGLIEGVFHAIVKASIEQMEAYGKLVADVAKTLNQFRDENVSVNQGRDHLVDTFPDLFEITVDTGENSFDDSGGGPRVVLRDGVDSSAAAKKVNETLPLDKPLSSVDDESIEGQLVPAARTQLATSRQQLLATMVLMGINRIIVTEGKIQAKVVYDFKARDNFKYRYSATQFDYDDTKVKRTMTGESETEYDGGDRQYKYDKDGGSGSARGASYYTKGNYKYSDEPVLTLASATTSATDASLDTRASLAGNVEVNFKSETFPLEKMADSFQIGRIQNASKPGGTTPTGAALPTTQAPAPATTPPPTAGTTK